MRRNTGKRWRIRGWGSRSLHSKLLVPLSITLDSVEISAADAPRECRESPQSHGSFSTSLRAYVHVARYFAISFYDSVTSRLVFFRIHDA